MSKDDIFYMREALIEAKKSFDSNEVPVGAILIYEKKIIARGHNQVELKKDATAHAEMICLQQGAQILGNWRLLDCTLYTTLEPCAMCAGAAILSRVKKIVYGARDLRQGGDGSWIELLKTPHPIHQVEVVGGVLEEASSELLKNFFKNRREEKRCMSSCLKNS
jgi:tRNA(adenine34) deaminase